MTLPTVKMTEGIHVMHLFYRVDRMAWDELSPRESEAARERLEALCAANNNASHPSLRCFANVSGKADLAFWLFHEDLAQLAQMHRDLEACFPAGSIDLVYSYFSVTELTEYQPTEDDLKARAQREFKLEEGTPEFDAKMEELMAWKVDYEKLRLYPEMPDWDVMCFYPMLKKRQGEDNWYSLDFDTRKKLMRTHAITGRKYAGRISQLITGSVDRLILSRPAVEAGERLGFLPGDMKDKVDPYLRPIYDALYDTLPAEQVERRIASGEIEIAPLAFMRGRTLANAFIVLDEAQNTTIAQMKMFLTRFGEGSRMVICGDPKQVDLPQPGVSGLADAVSRLGGVEGIAMVPFGVGDVVRHPVVGRIVQAYEGPDA